MNQAAEAIIPVRVKNINIFPFKSRQQLLEHISIKDRMLIAINAEKILHSTVELERIVNNNIGYADGIGATIALSRKGNPKAIKIPGCELWLTVIEYFCETRTFYLVGSTDEVINNTVKKLKIDFPKINIVGYRNGYIKSTTDKEGLINDIKDKKPEIIFVAMGSPKQELLMEELQQKHAAIYQGLGGSFDVYTGRVKRAPAIWVKLKLEWFYRLLLEPSRIKRQIHLVRFIYLLLLNKI